MPAVFAHVCASTGWTWDYVEESLDFPRLSALSQYWQQHPPTHVLLAARYEYKPPSKKGAGINTTDDIAALVQAFGGVQS